MEEADAPMTEASPPAAVVAGLERMLADGQREDAIALVNAELAERNYSAPSAAALGAP